jgi:hypothetical protein
MPNKKKIHTEIYIKKHGNKRTTGINVKGNLSILKINTDRERPISYLTRITPGRISVKSHVLPGTFAPCQKPAN